MPVRREGTGMRHAGKAGWDPYERSEMGTKTEDPDDRINDA